MRKVGPRLVVLLTAGALAGLLGPARASGDVFGMGPGLKSLELLTVSDPGNAPNVYNDYSGNPMGSVAYTYQIGKYDVTAAQYCQFLNAVATQSDPFGLYNGLMDNPGVPACGIARSGTPGNYAYSLNASRFTVNNGNLPVNFVSWGSAARFCNWVTNGQPTGPEGAGTTETGSYTLSGAIDDANLMQVTRNADARYVLPTSNEWYKAAFYKGGAPNAGYWLYPTRSNTPPSNDLSTTGTNNANFYDGQSLFIDPNGYTDSVNILTEVGAFASSPGPYGTFDMGGNVFQWSEGSLAASRLRWGVSASYRGSTVYFADRLMSAEWGGATGTPSGIGFGFRVVEVPEPTVIIVLACASPCILGKRKHRVKATD